MSLYDTGVRQLVDDYLVEESRKVRDYGSYWSASSAGYCMRKVIFERLGVPKIEQEGDARKQRVFTAGHIFHDWIQGITKSAGVSIAQEVELQDEDLMIRGHFDDLILADDKLILYDYKTVNSRSFMWAKKNGNTMSHFHRMQLGTYMYMLRKGINERLFDYKVQMMGLSEARILKIEKENLMMGEQQLMWTPDLERDVVQYWTTLNGYWKAIKYANIEWLRDNITTIGAEQWIEYAKWLSVQISGKSSLKQHQGESTQSNTEKAGVMSILNTPILTQTVLEENMLTKQAIPELCHQMVVPISPSTVLSWSKSLEDHLRLANLSTTLTEIGVTTNQIILSFGLGGLDTVNELARLNATTVAHLTAYSAQTMPKCTCADYEGGFMAKEAYNGYYYEGEPCSMEYYKKWKAAQK